MTYKQLLEQDPKSVQAENLEFQARELSLQLQADVLATQKSIAQLELRVKQAKSAVPSQSYSVNVINAIVTLRNMENGLKELLELQAELFPAEG